MTDIGTSTVCSNVWFWLVVCWRQREGKRGTYITIYFILLNWLILGGSACYTIHLHLLNNCSVFLDLIFYKDRTDWALWNNSNHKPYLDYCMQLVILSGCVFRMKRRNKKYNCSSFLQTHSRSDKTMITILLGQCGQMPIFLFTHVKQSFQEDTLNWRI